ncbi:hypothetical protein vseg_001170 [Gypsophila vaccaria]
MDPNNPAPRKLKFTPKPQNRRVTRLSSSSVPKTEQVDDEDVYARQQLLQRYNEHRQRQQPKVETSVQVAFTNESKPVATPRVSDGPRDGGRKESSELDLMQLDDNIGKSSKSSSSIAGPSEAIANRNGSTNDRPRKTKKYKEPWDYNTYYPTTLPWRRPFSGDPDILDDVEFGEMASNAEYDETTINPASELGLLNPDETGENHRLLFFQLPQSLPAMKRFASAKGKEKEGSFPPPNQKDIFAFDSDRSSINAVTSQRTCKLEDLSSGQMGKLLVYKSGAVKLKLGETLYNVSPGVDCSVAQDVVAFDIKKKICCEIGGLDGQAVVTPDIDYLLNSMIDLG